MAPQHDAPAEAGDKEELPAASMETAAPTKEESSKKREQNGTISPRNSPAKKRKTKQDVDDMAWICGECHEAEYMLDPSVDFILCDGTCFRVFHYACVGLSHLPDNDDEWFCKDCTLNRHQCAFCHEFGEDNVDVFSCRKTRCGLYFHESCLEMHNVEVTTTTAVTTLSAAPNDDDASRETNNTGDVAGPMTETTSVPVFTCPAHSCWTCTQKDLQRAEQKLEQEKSNTNTKTNTKRKKAKKKKKQQSTFQCKSETRIFRCLYCPSAFHSTCIPPTSRFHELAVLCPEHSATHKLPELDLSTSFQSSVEDQIDQKMLKLSGKKKSRSLKKRTGANPFFPGMRGNRLESQEKYFLEYLAQIDEERVEANGEEEKVDPASVPSQQLAAKLRDLDFCLPCDVKTEVHSKPPAYKFTHTLKYDPNNKPKKIPPTGEKCQCVGSCGDDCFNRILLIECCGDGKKNSNCNVGSESCGNRSLGKRQIVKCKPKREGGRGWGLVTLEAVPRGKLVQEYVGDVIDERAKEQRLEEWNKEHPNDPNFYVMALTGGWYIDARECANMSRFINHSCDPNCILATINVKGYKRNGIFSKRDIAAGEFLSYDYHFDTKQGDRFVCRCGSKKCRGTMKGNNNNNGSALSKKPATWKEAKARYEQDKKFMEERESQKVISQVGALIPAAEQPGEFVMAGPPEKHRDSAVRNRIFLWRNSTQGADFVSRNSRLEATSTTSNNKPSKAPSSSSTTAPEKEMDMLSVLRKNHADNVAIDE